MSELETDGVVNKIRSWSPDVVMLDIYMPEKRGIDILQELRRKEIDAQVIMLTADDTAETAVKAMKLGAADYLTKPFNMDEVRIVISNIVEKQKLKHEVEYYRNISFKLFEKELLGEADLIKDLKAKAERMAQAQMSSVLISGESGFDGITMGLGLVKETFPRVKVVSRAHGYDIYEELYFPHYWPLRRETLARLDGLFPASYDGRDYLRNHYPGFRDLIETAHLGIEAPGFVSQPSSDGIFRILSCAQIVPLKRLDLLLDSITFAARMRPSQKFEWIHFGDGKAGYIAGQAGQRISTQCDRKTAGFRLQS